MLGERLSGIYRYKAMAEVARPCWVRGYQVYRYNNTKKDGIHTTSLYRGKC